MALTFQPEMLSQIVREFGPLMLLHWQELADNRDKVALDPNYDYYLALEKAGTLSVVTARDNGRLVGYYVSLVAPHPHYKSTLFGFVDMYFLLPEFRNAGNGMRLFMETEREMRAVMKRRGQKKMVLIGRGRFGHNPQPILERLGWKPVETAYTKFLEADNG